jgi:hypothetical protein
MLFAYLNHLLAVEFQFYLILNHWLMTHYSLAVFIIIAVCLKILILAFMTHVLAIRKLLFLFSECFHNLQFASLMFRLGFGGSLHYPEASFLLTKDLLLDC